jgi:hypothetical protein
MPHSQLHREWRYLFDPTDGLAVGFGATWHSYPIVRQLAHSAIVSTQDRQALPAGPNPMALPASITPTPEGDYRVTYGNVIPPPLAPREPPPSEQGFLRSLRDSSSGSLTARETRLMPGGHSALLALLETGGVLWMVSDGGAIPSTDLGSYGYVGASCDVILFEGGGQVPCGTNDMNSFRAELCGGWINFRFLSRFCTYYQVTISPKFVIKYHCDSDSALRRLTNSHSTSQRFQPSKRLRADYDMEMAAQSEMTIFTIQFCEVTGHKDLTTAWDDLSWPEQLNARADEIATYQLERATRHFNIPLIPSTRAELLLGRFPVTNQYASQIRTKLGFPVLKKYLLSKNPHWTPAVWNTIDWAAHGAALSNIRRQPGRNTRMQKFLASKLPVGNIVRHYSTEADGRCPSCGANRPETEDHIFRCPDPVRQQTRRNLLPQLQIDLQDIQTAPDLLRFIMTGLHRWIQTGRDDYKPTRRCFRTLALSQSAIGWAQIWRGRISLEFASHQEKFFRRNHADSTKCTGPLWAKKFIVRLWDFFEILWKNRNDALHPDDPAAAARLHLAALRTRVHKVYSQAASFRGQDRAFFRTPVETRMQDTPRTIENWLLQVEPLVVAIASTPVTHDLSQRTLHFYFQLQSESQTSTPPDASTVSLPVAPNDSILPPRTSTSVGR